MTCVSIEHISKQFYGIPVLNDVSMNIGNSEIFGLIGENGAGKSTLMNIISGLVPRDDGKIILNGVEHNFVHPRVAEQHGIIHIHQELNIFPDLKVVDNLFLGKEIHKYGVLDKTTMNDTSKEIFSRLGQDFDIQEFAGNLSIGHQQMIEIAKAFLHNDVKLIILDEPTASLAENESTKLFEIMELLRSKEGVSFVYVSHRLQELFRVCDTITVLRDGKCIGTRQSKETTLDEIVTMMIGRTIEDQYVNSDKSTTIKNHLVATQEEVLRVHKINRKHKFQNISFSLYKGEILGFSGLIGAGRTDVMHAIFGSYPPESGTIFIEGQNYTHPSPSTSLRKGIAFLSEDRKEEGILDNFSVMSNISISNYTKISTMGMISPEKETNLVESLISQLSIKVANFQNSILTLSGGNQQKSLFARSLNIELKILILDEPTRGVDVGAKRDIYQIMHKLTEQGIAIIVVSSDLPEILGISDRIAVMHEGSLIEIVDKKQANQELIMHLSTNTSNLDIMHTHNSQSKKKLVKECI